MYNAQPVSSTSRLRLVRGGHCARFAVFVRSPSADTAETGSAGGEPWPE